MFLWDNIFLVVLIGSFFFILFTLVNLMIDIKHPITAIVLTYHFLFLLIKMPFEYTNYVYNSREKFLKIVTEDKRATEKTNKHFEKVFRNRLTIFVYFLQLGFFTYSRTMEKFLNSFNERPFKIEIIFDLNKSKLKTKAFEEDIHQDMARSLNIFMKQYV